MNVRAAFALNLRTGLTLRWNGRVRQNGEETLNGLLEAEDGSHCPSNRKRNGLPCFHRRNSRMPGFHNPGVRQSHE